VLRGSNLWPFNRRRIPDVSGTGISRSERRRHVSAWGSYRCGTHCKGTVTGLLNTVLRISALLSGILMMVGVYSVNLRIMGGANVPLLRQVTAFDLAGRLFSLHGMSLSDFFRDFELVSQN